MSVWEAWMRSAEALDERNREMNQQPLSEADAAIAYANAWNHLDASEFVSLLADDARYVSMYSFSDVEGKEAINDYFKVRIKAIRDDELTVFGTMARTTQGWLNRPCVMVAQGTPEDVRGVVLFDIEADKIRQFDLCVPALYGPEPVGDVRALPPYSGSGVIKVWRPATA